MRFKARITELTGILKLQRSVSTIARLSKPKAGCKLRLSPDTLHFALLDDGSDVNVWSEIRQDALFSVYKIESLHENNEILLTLNLEHFSRALRSAGNATTVVLRLTKRGATSYLMLQIGTTSASGGNRPIVHEVPVAVSNHAEIAAIQPPELPVPEVNVYLPPFRTFKTVVDKMRAMSELIRVGANEMGEMVLKVETATVSVKTYFKGLENASYKGPGASDDHGIGPAQDSMMTDTYGSSFREVTVAIRALHQFLAAHQSNPENVLLSVAHGRALILFEIQDDANLTYYIPIRDE